MTQTEKILQYIKDFGSINPGQAYSDLGIYRLSARIQELRESGYRIKSEMVSDKNRYGESVRYAVYSLEA